MEQNIELIKAMSAAIKNNDLNTIENLLENNPDLLHAESVFGNWIQEAVREDNYELTEFFIKKGVDINFIGGSLESNAISDASYNGNLEIVKLLYKNGARLETCNSSCNPLFAAIANQKAEADEQVYEVKSKDSNYVVMDIEGVKRIEIQCTIPKKEAQMKFDILSDVGEYDNFKEKSTDGNYSHVEGCDYLGKDYHKILDKKILNKYQSEGIDELYLVFANRNLVSDSKVKVSIKYVYYKDSAANTDAE